MNKLQYKGYTSVIKQDPDTHKLYGKIDGIKDFVNFIADNMDSVEKEFHDAVDAYLDFCLENNKEPEISNKKIPTS